MKFPIVVDPWVSREFGAGAVKATPAHDSNDFAIGERHHLPSINVMDDRKNAAGRTRASSTWRARKLSPTLKRMGCWEPIKDYTNNVGHCDRCKTWSNRASLRNGLCLPRRPSPLSSPMPMEQGYSLYAGELREDLSQLDG